MLISRGRRWGFEPSLLGIDRVDSLNNIGVVISRNLLRHMMSMKSWQNTCTRVRYRPTRIRYNMRYECLRNTVYQVCMAITIGLQSIVSPTLDRLGGGLLVQQTGHEWEDSLVASFSWIFCYRQTLTWTALLSKTEHTFFKSIIAYDHYFRRPLLLSWQLWSEIILSDRHPMTLYMYFHR